MEAHESRNTPPDTGAPGATSSVEAFPIVGIGVSAGGLQALPRFFDALPEAPGMAFVLVHRLDPEHASEVVDLLKKHTRMSVSQVERKTDVRANHVYVVPPGKRPAISGGELRLSDPGRSREHRTLIDAFFRSLAEDGGERAVCVILSGTGSEGSVGLEHIKERGGVVFVQDPADAEFAGMPRSALATNLVDVTAPAGALARKLVAYRDSAERIQLPKAPDKLPEDDAGVLRSIFTQLQGKTGHDFSRYKRSTILRRLQRRMQVNQVLDMSSYLQLLRQDEQEAKALMKEFLISVTSFFRDEDAFEALEQIVLPALFEGKGAGDQVRVWVPGCATGEEAYAIALLLCEHVETIEARPELQVFASDLDVEALAFARQGRYPEAIAPDVSSERLDRYFERKGRDYVVSKAVRDVVLFAQHNLIKDPPFSRLDLISCRNLLIYLERDVQRHLFELFHHALREGGWLFLGSSETTDDASPLFEAVDKTHRIYRRHPGPSSLPMTAAGPAAQEEDAGEDDGDGQEDGAGQFHLGPIHRELMLQTYAPPSVIVDADYEIRYLFGDVGRYLRPAEGAPTQNLLEKVTKELRVELRAALFQCFRKGQDVELRRIRATIDGTVHLLTLRVEAIDREDIREHLALVIFEPVPQDEAGEQAAGAASYDATVVEQLEDELQRTKQDLQAVIEEYESSNEELKDSNRELQSMNVELRSTTEELETSKEELQSANEELQTVNQELKGKIEDLNRSNSDLQNLMESTEIGTLFLDCDLCLKRYTPAATDLFNIIPTDVGRPFQHLSHKIDHEDLPDRAAHVLRTLETVEEEVQGEAGGYYLMRIRPYRTVDDRIDGVVLTFIDITDQKKAQEEERERARHQAVLAELREHALKGSDPKDLMDAVVREVAQTLDVEYCKVLQLQPDEDVLLLRAGVGWKEGYVGAATVGTERDSQAGYTLVTTGPVIVDDLREEKRFSGPELLTEHDVVSGMSVVLQGAAQPYGVLGAHTTRRRTFTEQEAHFMQSVADLLGMALERYLAEAAVRESEQRYRTALANTPIVFAKVDAELRYEWVFNPHPDFAPSLLEGKRDDELDAGAGIEALVQLKRDVLEGGRQQRRTIPFQRSDGTRTYDVTATPLTDEQGRVTHVVTSALDITERRQAEEALQEREEMLRAVIDQMPSGLSIAEAPSGKLLLHNEEAVRLLRHPPRSVDDTTGYVQYGAVHEDGTSYRAEEYPIARALQGETIYQEMMHYRRGDGTRTIFSVNAAPVRDAAGEIIMAVSTFHDISEIKRYDRELKALNETLEQRVRERTKQVRSLASSLTLAEQRERHRVAQILHDDLQQLLYGAQVQLGMVEEHLGAEAVREAEMLQKMDAVIRRAIQVARTLTVDLSPPVLKGEGLTEAIRWLASQMKEVHGLEVKVEADGPLHVVDKDMRVLLFQLLRELLFNVVKHAGVGAARVMLHQDEHHLRVEVEDEGKGFDVEDIRGDENERGGSFGLFSVQERLGLFGGHLEVETAPGKGTRALITVPTELPTYDQR